MATQVGVEMWFKVGRAPLTARDIAAMIWWLKRNVGTDITGPVIVLPVLASVLVEYRDPLQFRSYYGDGSWQHGAADGQVRVGGGVKGWI